MVYRLAIILVVLGLTVIRASAQLWLEDFTAESNGATSGTASGSIGGTWTTNYPGTGTFARGTTFITNLPALQASNTGSEGVFSTNVVDISAAGYAIIAAQVYSFSVEANDYVRMSYVLDGVEVNFYELIGGNPGSFVTPATPASAIVAGSTLQIKIYIKNDFNTIFGFQVDDAYWIDDISITAAPAIYSRNSGTWNDASVNGTWSLTGHTGSACLCVPLNNQVAIIGNSNTVTVPTSQINLGLFPSILNLAPGAIDIQNTGTLQFNTSNAALGLANGLVRVRSGGTINNSGVGVTGESITFNASVGGASFQVDAGGSATFDNIILGPAATSPHFLVGAGTLTVTDDILIDAAGSSITNDFTGTLTVGDRVEFQNGVTDCIFVNNQPLTIPTLYFDDDNETFTNNSTLTITDLQSGAGDDNNLFTNSVGAILNLGNVTTNNGNMSISNSGTINQSGNFISMDAGSGFTNLGTGIWNWSLAPNSTYDTDLNTVLNCSASGNLFNYSGAGAQSIVPITYYNLTTSNSGAKTATVLVDVNGDLQVLNSASLSPGTFGIDVQGNLSIQNTGVISGTGAVNVGGNWSAVDASSYVQGTRTTTFDGAAAQVISNASGVETFYNLVLTGSGIKSSSNFIDIDNDVSIGGTTQLDVSNDINLGGNWAVTSTNGNPFVEGTNTVTLDGALTQSITTVLGAGETFYNLSITGANAKSNVSIMNISNDLTIGGSSATTTLAGAGDINIAGDWTVTNASATNPFTEGTRLVTFNGSSPQAISTVLAAGERFYDLEIDNSSPVSPQVTINNIVAISHALTMTTGVAQTTSTNLLILKNAATSTTGSATSYVDGPMQFDMGVINTTRNLNFPIGKSGSWGGVTLRVRHNAATSYSYTAEVINSSAAALPYTLAASTDKVSSMRYWDIKRGTTAAPLVGSNANLVTAGAGNAPRITLNYLLVDGVSQTANLTIVKTNAALTAWLDITGTATGSPSGSVISANPSANFTSFSLFTLANKTGGTNPLPIDLVYFNATLDNDEVLLNWRTATERNNDFFTVERAFDVEKFDSIGTVPGSGASTIVKDYSMTDPSPIYGRSYYRLKQTDFDRNFTYSNVAVVDYDGPRFPALRAYPNPSNGSSLKLLVTGLRDQHEVPIQISATTGTVVFERTFSVSVPGTLSEDVVLPNRLAQGVYIIRAGASRYLTQKLVVE